MPFTNTPTADTYSAHRIDLTREILKRSNDTSKDEDYLNVFLETVKSKSVDDKRMFVTKRAGTSTVKDSVFAGVVRGAIFWAEQNKLVYCVDNDVYVYNVNSGATTTLSNVFATTTGDVGMCLFLYDNQAVKVVATDGTATTGMITIDSANTVVTCADADLPAHLPYPVFLDGYVFVAGTSSASIYNSDLNDPLSWTAGDFLDAEFEGDWIRALAKVNNYIVAFGGTTIEYFWDAANTTSPLQKNDTPVKITKFIGGLAQYENNVFFLGVNESGQPDLFKLDGFKATPVGTATVCRYLQSCSDGMNNWRGGIISFMGHTFYVLNAGTAATWVYDLDTQIWIRWAYQATSVFPLKLAVTVERTNTINSYFAFTGSSSTIYKFDESVYQDAGTNFTAQIVTEANDFDTLRRKTMANAVLIGDRPSADSNITVYWSDDDYQTWSNGLTTNLNQDYPNVRRLGSFRQRCFKLTYTDNYPMRLQTLECEINKGLS